MWLKNNQEKIMQTTTLSNLPPQVQQMLPELIALDSAQRLSLIHWLSTEIRLRKSVKTGYPRRIGFSTG